MNIPLKFPFRMQTMIADTDWYVLNSSFVTCWKYFNIKMHFNWLSYTCRINFSTASSHCKTALCLVLIIFSWFFLLIALISRTRLKTLSPCETFFFERLSMPALHTFELFLLLMLSQHSSKSSLALNLLVGSSKGCSLHTNFHFLCVTLNVQEQRSQKS